MQYFTDDIDIVSAIADTVHINKISESEEKQLLAKNNNPKIKTSEIRKKQHIENFLKSKSNAINYFDDIILENNSLPELNFSEIDTNCVFLNKKADSPLMINAITGGFDGALEINKNLALLAKKFNIPIAVGSQSLGIKGYGQETYCIVRDIMASITV